MIIGLRPEPVSATQGVMMGYYSQKAVQFGVHTCIYLTPDGKEVEVTVVISKPEHLADYNWDDKVFVGEVTKWVRVGRAPSGSLGMLWRNLGWSWA